MKKIVNEKILEYEKEKKFNEHLNPVDTSICLPVDENFPFVPKAKSLKLKRFFQNLFIVKPFVNHINRKTKTKVFGKENIKNINSAIVTCNHIYTFDCLVAKKSLSHKMKMIGAEFNNRKDFLGEMMRAGGMLPLSHKISVMRKFNEAIKYYLDNNYFVLFYPEQAMWDFYEKPRPLKDGAFHYASKHNVAIIPTFITFREHKDEIYFDFHILKPIYPKNNLSLKENTNFLKTENYARWKEQYELSYNKKLKL